MTLHLTDAQESQLQDIAASNAQTPDHLAKQVIGRFLDYEADLSLAVQRGDEDITAGRVLPHEEVVARIERLLESR